MANTVDFVITTQAFQNDVVGFKEDYTKKVYLTIANYLDAVREGAYKEEIIPSKYPNNFNPKWLSRKQPSTPDRLTSRTGKMAYMMKHVVSNWKTTEGGMVMKTSGLLIRVTRKKGGSVEEFEGTMRPNITMDGRLSSTGRKMPRETTRTLTLRFYWETGIRGQKRPYLFPQAEKHFSDYATDLRRAKEGFK